MNTFKKIAIALVALAGLSFGQTALSSTTLSSAITAATCSTLTLNVASTSTMNSIGTQSNPGTVLYIDREYMWVNQVVDSTHVSVYRCRGGNGASMVPQTHASGATVLFANTNGSYPATSAFSTKQLNAESSGSCTATNEVWLPKVYLYSGDVLQCYNGSSGGQWFQVGVGTMNSYGKTISQFCTGSLGSAETEYLNSAACSGATTSTARYMVTTPGVLANLYASAGTAVSGGSNKDVLTVYKNGSATTITCTFATGGAATTCSDTAHSVATVAGDVITFQFVTASGDAGANIGAAVGLY